MSNATSMDMADARRLVQAAAWRTRLTETNTETCGAFEAWLAADPGNVAAWRQVQAPWDFFGDQATSPELIELRRVALGAGRDVALKRWLRSVGSHSRLRLAIAASLLIVAIGTLLAWNLTQPEIYR